MHDTTVLLEARVHRFIEERLRPAVYAHRAPLHLTAWEVPGEPVPFTEAHDAEYHPFTTGTNWGRPWGTVWFRMRGQIPETAPHQRPEIVIDLGFDKAQPGFQAEGLVYDDSGRIIKAVEPRNMHVPVDGAPGAAIDLYLEAAANPDIGEGFRLFTPTHLGDLATAGDAPLYVLRTADIAVRDTNVWELLQDTRVLVSLMQQLPDSSPRRAQILRALEDLVDTIDPEDVANTAKEGRAVLIDVLSSPASGAAHHTFAVGHAHIDSAWLWPVRETQRKIARTFANVLSLQSEKPEMIFAASSAQQYAWMKQYRPELYERMREAIAEGRFVPAGGMWVESDTNMPGGEALVRQFVHGKRFFIDEFGVEPLDVWLPDSFGYSAALPQIARAAGSRWMLTQKMSWNETNVMPHHTFLWEGIDGTTIFTHFPPVDTYNAELTGEELARAERQYAEKGRANTSLIPYGYGNGGGGPTREMVAAAERLRSLEGSPTVTMASPRDFFETAEAEYPHPPVWSGEMYLEFHRGTYTTQARTKRGNRRSEHALREAEYWAAYSALAGAPYPYDTLTEAWNTVLLNQFHDILPGTSISWVHQEAERRYAEVWSATEQVTSASLQHLTGRGHVLLHANAGPYAVGGVPSGSISEQAHPERRQFARARQTNEGYELSNAHLRVVIDRTGRITSLTTQPRDQHAHITTTDFGSGKGSAGREAIAPGTTGNQLFIYRDTPTQWDAWDIDEHYRRHATEIDTAVSIEIVADTPDAAVTVVREWGASRITQTLRLAPDAEALDIDTHVEWHERQKLLKLAFPFDVHTERATSEIQFGHVHRPLHTNTSWDNARFETVAHRWIHVGEPGFGVAVSNDATYGHDVTRIPRKGGGTATLVRLSLLRAPLYPDPQADQGEHKFRVSVRPAATIADAIRDGYRLNLPVRQWRGAHAVPALCSTDNDAVVIEAVKLAEDRSGDLIVRLYEAHGTRRSATLSTGFTSRSVTRTDLLERALEETTPINTSQGKVPLDLRPFELVTLRFAAPRLAKP